MKQILRFSVNDLRREISAARNAVSSIITPTEIAGYKEWLSNILCYFDKEVDKLQYYLSLQHIDSELLEALTTDFIRHRNTFSLLSNTYIPLLLRVNSEDLLALRFINWLHKEHEQTAEHPFIIANGDFSIYPSRDSPIRYHLPLTSQLSLLHLPLIFHEFGHLLFVKHREEMVELIKEYQKKLDEIIVLPIQRFDSKNSTELNKRSLIIETWFEWIEEMFCDLVGLTIGGASYLHAFSHFIRFGGSSSYFVTDRELARRSHPVSWLRLKIMKEHAIKLGLSEEYERVTKEWDEISKVLKVREDYFGYYDQDFHDLIQNTLGDMITEANPISFSTYMDAAEENLIKAVNEAWEQYLNRPDEYIEWESRGINRVLSMSAPSLVN
jgi:hypothetical protein